MIDRTKPTEAQKSRLEKRLYELAFAAKILRITPEEHDRQHAILLEDERKLRQHGK